MTLAPGAFALVLGLLAPASAPDADEDYQFIAGLAERGQHEQVVGEARDFLRRYGSDPRVARVRYRLGESLFALDRFEEALPEFVQLDGNRRFELPGEVDLRRGQCLLELARPSEAVEPLIAAADRGPEYLRVSANFLAAEALLRSDDAERADGRYAAVLTAGAGELAADAWHGRVWCAFELGRHGQCVERAGEFLGRHGDDPRADEVRFLAAESELERGQPERALAGYRAVRGAERAADALRGAGFAAAALDRHGEAADFFGAVLTSHPNSPHVGECALHRGIALLRAESVRDARAALADRRVPAGPETEYWRARAAAADGDHAASLAHAEAGLRASAQGDLATRLNLARGDALLALGRNREAAEAFESGGGEYALYSAAVAHLEDGRPAEALELAVRAARGEGDEARAAAVLAAEARLSLGRFDEAERDFNALMESEREPTERARLATRLGWASYQGGDAARARSAFLTGAAQREAPFAAEASFMSARCADDLGQSDAAIDGYADFLERWPGDQRRTEALVRLARLIPGGDGEQLLARAVADGGELGARARLDLAERLSDREQYATALQHYRVLVEAGLDRDLDHPARYGLAWCELAEGEAPAAAARLDALARADDIEAELRQSTLELLVWAARSAGDAALTRDAFARFAQTAPGEARLLAAARTASGALAEAGSGDAALALIESATRELRDPTALVAAHVEAAWLQLDAGNLAGAGQSVARARAARADDPGLAEASFFLAEAHFERGEDELAAALYRSAAPHASAELAPAAAYKWGFCELRRGELASAEARFEHLVETYPTDELVGETLFLLGEARYRDDRFAAALAPLERVLAEHPRHAVLPKARFRLGVSASRAGNHERAAEVLGDLARRHGNFEHLAEAELWRGRSLGELGQARAARAAFDRVIAADKGVLAARARIELGRLDVAAGDTEAALSHFLKVAVLYAQAEEVAEALFLAGQVLESTDRMDLARARYSEAAEKHPETAFGRRATERLRQVGGAR